MKWLWAAGTCVVLAAGIYTFIQEMRMHEYCRVYSPESWGWGDAGDAEMRANIWPEEMSRTIHVRLKFPFKTRPDDIVQITGRSHFLYEGPDPGNQLLKLHAPIKPSSSHQLVYLRVVLLRRSEMMACVFENPESIDLAQTPEGAAFLLEILPTTYVREYDEMETAVRMTRL